MKLLFISDISVSDPFLQSQGLPLLQSLETKSLFISFETKTRNEFKTYYNNILSFRFPNVEFHPIFLLGILPFGLENLLFGLLKTLYLTIRKDISTIHARSFIPSVIGLISKFLLFRKIYLIYDCRGIIIEEEKSKNNWKENCKKIEILKMIEKQLIIKSDSIVVVSEYFKEYILKNYLVDSKNITVIPNRTKINYYINNYEKENKLKVIYSGSCAFWQKIDLVLNLFKEIKMFDDDIECTILTYKVNTVKELVQQYRLSGKIRVASVESDSVFYELSKHNVGLLLRDDNIINNVSSPLKFAEYLQAGLPLLISKGIGDTETIIDKYKIGIITNNNDIYKDFLLLKQLIEEDKSIYQRCSFVAKKYFDIEQSFNQYKNIYYGFTIRKRKTSYNLV